MDNGVAAELIEPVEELLADSAITGHQSWNCFLNHMRVFSSLCMFHLGRNNTTSSFSATARLGSGGTPNILKTLTTVYYFVSCGSYNESFYGAMDNSQMNALADISCEFNTAGENLIAEDPDDGVIQFGKLYLDHICRSVEVLADTAQRVGSQNLSEASSVQKWVLSASDSVRHLADARDSFEAVSTGDVCISDAPNAGCCEAHDMIIAENNARSTVVSCWEGHGEHFSVTKHHDTGRSILSAVFDSGTVYPVLVDSILGADLDGLPEIYRNIDAGRTLGEIKASGSLDEKAERICSFRWNDMAVRWSEKSLAIAYGIS